jgi:hypothetical protein
MILLKLLTPVDFLQKQARGSVAACGAIPESTSSRYSQLQPSEEISLLIAADCQSGTSSNGS